GPSQTEKQLEQNRRDTALYIHTDTTLAEIGEKQGRSKQNVDARVKNFIRKLHSMSPDLQETYPLSSFRYRKQSSNDRIGKVREAEHITMILSLVEHGVSYDRLVKLGFTPMQINTARQSPRAKKRDIKV